MLLNLKTEIARARISQAKIARTVGIRPETMSDKVLEKTEFTRSEIFDFSAIFPYVYIKYLF